MALAGCSGEETILLPRLRRASGHAQVRFLLVGSACADLKVRIACLRRRRSGSICLPSPRLWFNQRVVPSASARALAYLTTGMSRRAAFRRCPRTCREHSHRACQQGFCSRCCRGWGDKASVAWRSVWRLATPIPVQSSSQQDLASQSGTCESVRRELLLAWPRRRAHHPSSAPAASIPAKTNRASTDLLLRVSRTILPARSAYSFPRLLQPHPSDICNGCLRPVPRARVHPKP